jgi:hypothetical protein
MLLSVACNKKGVRSAGAQWPAASNAFVQAAIAVDRGSNYYYASPVPKKIAGAIF